MTDWGKWVTALPLAAWGLTALATILLAWAAGAVTVESRDPPLAVVGLSLLILIFALVGVIVAGLVNHQIQPLNAAMAIIFGGVTLLVGAHALEALRTEDGAGLESHWGGLGGGLGGWRLSRAAVLSLLIPLLVATTLVASIADPQRLFTALIKSTEGQSEEAKSNKQVLGAGLTTPSTTPLGGTGQGNK